MPSYHQQAPSPAAGALAPGAAPPHMLPPETAQYGGQPMQPYAGYSQVGHASVHAWVLVACTRLHWSGTHASPSSHVQGGPCWCVRGA
eukprot:scaffold209390_cov15-Tisochrysis_lutea.AAC.1